MALRIWGKVLAAALGVGALVGAGQLGLAYGLSIVRFARSFDGGAENLWNAQLAWVSWFAMLAAIAGAVSAARVAHRHGYAPGIGARVALSLFGGLGAGVVVPLSMQPARAAELPQTVNPALVVGLASGLGTLAGMLAAVAVLSLRPFAWNVTAVAAAVWVAAVVSVVPWLGPRDPLPAVRLGVLQWTAQPADANRWVDTLGMPVAALLAGAVVAAVARWRRHAALGAALNGVAGAAPLALAYLIAGPGLNSDAADQIAPYLGSLVALPAGLLGSLLVTVVGRRTGTRSEAAATEPSSQAEPHRPAQIAGHDRSDRATNSGARDWPAGAAGQSRSAARDEPTEPLEPSHILPPVVTSRPVRPPRPAPQPPYPAQPDHSAPMPARDEEYVGWVSGLGPDGDSPTRRRPAGSPGRDTDGRDSGATPPRRASGDPLPRRQPGETLPRRTPGQRRPDSDPEGGTPDGPLASSSHR